MRFTLFDMRRAGTTTAYEIAPQSVGIPGYSQAAREQQETYFFNSPSQNGVATETYSTIF
jgi:hypothetical protein